MPVNTTDAIEEKNLTCTFCGLICEVDGIQKFDDRQYCSDCLEALTYICSCCGERFYKDDKTYEITGDICSECYQENFSGELCNSCNNRFDADDLYWFDDRQYCEECLDETTFVCDCCGTRFSKDDENYVDNGSVCNRCYDQNYTECSSCDRVIHVEDACYDEAGDTYHETPYCYSCFDKEINSALKNYSYKPEPIFYGEGIFYGIELEIDKGGEDSHNAKELLDLANIANNHIYCKRDASLENGFEIVSHPMSLEYHINVMPWKAVLERALSLGYCSHNSETSGLHIHVGRSELGLTVEEQESVIARILFFMERHWEYLLKFSRRTKPQIDRWASRYGCKENPKDTLKSAKESCKGRYSCINLTNYATIEFRIFRGTLRFQTFLATLQMVDEICSRAMDMSDESFQQLGWSDFVHGINKERKLELVNYLAIRGLDRGNQ